MQTSDSYQSLKYQTLYQYWNYSSFRVSQEEAIDSLISGKDTLVLMPTGGGKSLCYQLPALLCEGMCLVVSPLLALMKDQVSKLQSLNIPAEYLSSEMEDYQMDTIYQRCREGLVKILFVSPERLLNSAFLLNMQDINLSFIAVDEAHCISEWGQDFRPSYQNIQKFRDTVRHLPCLALTATATSKVIDEICKKLSLNNPAIFKLSYERKNLSLQMMEVEDKYKIITQVLSYHSGAGLIYTRTRREAEELYQFLKHKKIPNVDFFHAGLSASEKNKKQKKWLTSHNDILICTNAFGMGIDKQDVSFIIHLSPPASIENYYQEVGRAGRNGNQAHAFLLWNPSELMGIDTLMANQFPSKKEFARIVRAVYGLCQIADHESSNQTFQLSLERIAHVTKCTQSKVKVVLTFLTHQEYIYYNTQKSSSAIQLLISPEDITLVGGRYEYFLELLLRSLPGVSQQRVFFNEKTLCEKLMISHEKFQDQVLYMREKGFLEYTNGVLSRLNFLRPREDSQVEKTLWKLFYNIQKNKIQKWEEMKFLLRNTQYCKMNLILSYFGEKTSTQKCGHCSICQKNTEKTGNNLPKKILETLATHPMELDEIALRLVHFDREDILDTIIDLRDKGFITMQDFRTYKLA